MSESARADFTANVTLTTREHGDMLSTRVLLSDNQLVFATDETKTVVVLSDIFDVAQDVPSDAPPDTTATITIGFNRGERRETATIECQAQTLAKFQTVLFKLLLSDMSVVFKRLGDGTDVGKQGERATLDVSPAEIRFQCDNGTLVVSRDDIEQFKTAKAGFQGSTDQPIVVIYSHQNGQAVRTKVCLPSFRLMNLLGRFLQSSPEAGFDATGDATPASITVLLVDDDPSDVEMTELMLKQCEERLAVTTATSAAGGLDLLESEPIDCIVSDYAMPGTDGIEFLQQVRADYPELPFVLFTGQGSEDIAKQALLSDVNDYVEKGIGENQYKILADRIRKALR